MPTENRSSNTEMVSELAPCPFCGQHDAFVEQLDSDASVVICQGRVDEHSACLARGPVGIQEDDDELQPGHGAAVREWNLRTQPAKHPLDEPVAWMVGSAIWWTKEQAELDSKEVGEPVIALGPCADPGEVERLSAQFKDWQASHHRNYCKAANERDHLRGQLEKARRLLHTASIRLARWLSTEDDPRKQIIEFLEASAEPSALVECAICRDLGDQCLECEEAEFVTWADKHFASADYRKTDAGVYIKDWMRHAFAAWQARGAVAGKA